VKIALEDFGGWEKIINQQACHIPSNDM
jgi:hypothetical protein